MSRPQDDERVGATPGSPGGPQDREAAARVRDELRRRCVHLCTKTSFFPLADQDASSAAHPGAIWWCLRTHEALGPDGTAAHPTLCGDPARRCHEPPVRP